MAEAPGHVVETAVHARNFPASPLSVASIRDAGYHRDDLWLPSVVARQSAIRHNATRFAQWCRGQGVELAPHGKTSMSPQLWHLQLEHGAWAITAATVTQARTMHETGVRRVLIANEILDSQQARWVAQANAQTGTEVFCLLDSPEGVQVLHAAAEAAEAQIPVLIEYGVTGRRTGVRDLAQGMAVAQQVLSSERLRLVGVEGYEGVLPAERSAGAVEKVSSWLDEMVKFIHSLDQQGCFGETQEILITAGGSAFPDLAAKHLRGSDALSKPVRPIIRSGCYLTHDHQSYERTSPLRSAADSDPLSPALTCIARVNSVPEAGQALLTVGKRDVPIDVDMPIILRVEDHGGNLRGATGLEITELNDHHGFVSDPDQVLRPGDLVELGLSHPCTTFDKWPLIPVLDDDDNVVDAIRTFF